MPVCVINLFEKIYIINNGAWKPKLGAIIKGSSVVKACKLIATWKLTVIFFWIFKLLILFHKLFWNKKADKK